MDGTTAAPLTAVVVGSRALQDDLERTGFVVVGLTACPAQAVGLVARLHPSVVLLAPDPWGPDGLATLEQVMAASPRPVVVRAALAPAEAAVVMAAGAVDVVDPAAPAELLAERLRLAARVRVIRHPRATLRPTPAPGRVRLVVVGASTGGPKALATVLAALPADLEPAVLVVQHMAQGFLPGPDRLARPGLPAAGPGRRRGDPAAARHGHARPRRQRPGGGGQPPCSSAARRPRPASCTCPPSTSPSPAWPRRSARARSGSS